MSTDLRPLKTIHMSDLFDGRLERFNIRESQNKDSSDQNRCLTDGYNYLWVYGGDDGTVGCFTRYFPNGNPSFILKHICDEFATRIVSENEPEFYGCESEEELEAMWERMAQEDKKRFYGEILKFLADQPCDIYPGTSGMEKATIAKTLVAQNPPLALAENWDVLLAQIDEIYERRHPGMVFHLDESEVASELSEWRRLEELPTLELMLRDTTQRPEDK